MERGPPKSRAPIPEEIRVKYTGSKVKKLPGLSRKQLELRRGIIGGTDAPAILGLSSYRSAFDVYAEKVGEAPLRAEEPNGPALWGLLLEPVVLARYEVETGRRLRVPKRLIRNDVHRWMAGHLDGIDRELVFEAKTARFAEGWGEPGTDQIPPFYKAQVWHYMAVTRRRRADVAVLIGGQDFRIYRLEWDVIGMAELVQEELEFRELHILPRIPPDVDGSLGAERWLRRQHPIDDGSELVAMPEQYALLTDFVNARHRKDIWEAQEKRLKQAIMQAMGPAAKLLSPMVRITYGRARDGVAVNWEGYANHLAGLLDGQVDIETVRGLYTSPKEGQRQFRVHIPKLQLEDNR